MSNKICVADCSHHFRSSLLVHNECRPPSTSGQTRLRKQERIRIKMAVRIFLALSTLGALSRLAVAQPSQNVDSLVILYIDTRTCCVSVFTDSFGLLSFLKRRFVHGRQLRLQWRNCLARLRANVWRLQLGTQLRAGWSALQFRVYTKARCFSIVFGAEFGACRFHVADYEQGHQIRACRLQPSLQTNCP